MLPSPVTLPKRRAFRRNSSAATQPSTRRIINGLFARARVTNLALVILLSFAALSTLFNLSLYFPSTTSYSSVSQAPWSILSTLSRGAYQNLNHLVIVPGHAIWKGLNPDLRLDEDEWILEPYQKGGGRIATFFDHIAKGAELAVDDEKALVVFSGGQTRPKSTSSEGESYLRLALAVNVFRTSAFLSPFSRATTEDYALDSFQNLIFSIARFHEFTGRYPDKITIVGYEMKRRRFTELHRTAIRWPLQKFHYIGIDSAGEDGVSAREGERQNGYLPYSADAYGCHSTLLAKRRARNPFARFHSYHSSSPELRALFEWCPTGKTTLFQGPLPWDYL